MCCCCRPKHGLNATTSPECDLFPLCVACSRCDSLATFWFFTCQFIFLLFIPKRIVEEGACDMTGMFLAFLLLHLLELLLKKKKKNVVGKI